MRGLRLFRVTSCGGFPITEGTYPDVVWGIFVLKKVTSNGQLHTMENTFSDVTPRMGFPTHGILVGSCHYESICSE